MSAQHKSYEDLAVWQKSVLLGTTIYRICKRFPKEEQFGLCSQMRRSAVSVSSNIAEGCGRNNYGEFVQFLGIASGSLAELHTQLLIALDAQYLTPNEFNETLGLIKVIGRMISGLKANLKTRQTELVTSN